jgi:hypothetical protein
LTWTGNNFYNTFNDTTFLEDITMAEELHIRYDGRSYDLKLDALDLGDLSSDAEVRQAVATHLEVPPTKLANFAVDKADGNITLRPQAVFGQ